ncbi:thioredoxin domain-containing protein [Paenibacillus antri]|uniref:Thioredoxin domain-containing protein n=1 Tax=Paenibacillus antri TaxID=2582848 RepID=A0A5R9G9U0_9BACL|nr:thioredoxin domain-containing protein [Paenibacillus antri]TLS53207.1 thioredoxin domain-containing protein [Paenibacillus antri]
MTTNKKPNRLAQEKSPYLLQHAYNPVDWFAWSDEAFEKAKREKKPIFLSIGYSTCHWCHVMERESFEDDEAAGLLNREFVSIKVDREERPDVDNLYMTVCQAMTGQGGWPLTIVMTPDKKPFFAGTYFPKRKRFGRNGLIDVLEQIAGKWKENAQLVIDAGETVADQTARRMISNLKGEVTESLLDESFVMFKQLYDGEYGGFGEAPKFPTPHNLMYLLRYYASTGEDDALQMAEKTLDAMYRGGLFDHIGFGFARYSTDREWLVPHFEKMLYDNALLGMAYTEAYQLTGKAKYREIAELVYAYVLRDMKEPDGGFYSAEDADAEGEEGKFTVWTPEEVREALGAEDGEWFCDVYGITAEGNFEGRSIPNLLHGSLESQAARSGTEETAFVDRADRLRHKLFLRREERVHPGKDDKVLTSWNGLMIASLAKAAAAFDRPEYAEAATSAVRFVLEKLRTPEGRLLARYRDGDSAFPGYIDDYAFLTWGLIELYQATFEPELLRFATELTQDAVRLFWDEEGGGFYFYGSDAEQLFTRMKEVYDGAIPAGNSVMANNLLRLARLTGEQRLTGYAERIFAAFAGAAKQYPTGHSMMLMGLSLAYGKPQEIVIAGTRGDAETEAMLRAARSAFLPHAVVLLRDEALPHLADKTPVNGAAAAYVCENYACQAPVTSAEALKAALKPKEE